MNFNDIHIGDIIVAKDGIKFWTLIILTRKKIKFGLIYKLMMITQKKT